MKELGASIKFNTLLEGESLLNDGTAYVFFLVCLDIVTKGSFELWPSIIKFFKLSLGGPVFGTIVGWLASKWIISIAKDSNLIVVITFFTCYLVFYVAEIVLNLSGSLALVALGVYMSQFAKVKLSEENSHAVHNVWSFCGFVLETLIFLITGAFIGVQILNYEELTLVPADGWKALLFYPYLNLIRYAVTLIQLPILNKIGYTIPCNWVLILTYGGLRGAIALSLAMIVAVDMRLSSELRHLCLFYVVTAIAFTVCINGLTIKYLMKWSGFLTVDPIKKKMKLNVLRKMLIDSLTHEFMLKEDKELIGADWDMVEELTHLSNYKLLNEETGDEEVHEEATLIKKSASTIFNSRRKRKLKSNNEIKSVVSGNRVKSVMDLTSPRKHQYQDSDRRSLNKSQFGKGGSPVIKLKLRQTESKGSKGNGKRRTKKMDTFKLEAKNINKIGDEEINMDVAKEMEEFNKNPFETINKEDLIKEVRDKVYQLIKHQTHERLKNNLCRKDAALSIIRLCNMCADKLTQNVCIMEYSDDFIGKTFYYKLLRKLTTVPIIKLFFIKYLAEQIFFNYQFLDTLVKSSRKVNEILKEIVLNIHFKPQVDKVRGELVQNMADLQEMQESILNQFEGMVGFIRTKMAAYNIVEFQKRQVKEYEHQGLLTEREIDDWAFKFDMKITQIHDFRPKNLYIEVNSGKSFVIYYPMFSCLNEEEINLILASRTKEEFKKNCK